MRFDRVVIPCLLFALAGCVTTHTNTGALGKPLPQESKAEQATDAARIHTELGQHYLATGDLQTALSKVQMALQFDPNYAPAHTVLAYIDARIGKLAEAEQHYRNAVALEPTKGAWNNNLGQFLCSRGNYAEGETYFRKAVADPFYATPSEALANAGVCQLMAGDKTKAEADFRDAIARNPQNGEALFQLANLLYQGKDAFRARAFLQRFDALGKPTAAALKLGYDIESSMGNPEGARNYLKRLRSQFPDSEQAHALDSIDNP